MVEYEPNNSKPIVVDGKRMSEGRARHIRDSLDEKLSIHDEFKNSDKIPENCAVTSLTVKLLCTNNKQNRDRVFEVGIALDESDEEIMENIPDTLIEEWIDKWDNHGKAVVHEENIEPLFDHLNQGEVLGFKVTICGLYFTI